MIDLKPCPFCGASPKKLVVSERDGVASISCACGITLKANEVPERYVQIRDNLYERIPGTTAKDTAAIRWNRIIRRPVYCRECVYWLRDGSCDYLEGYYPKPDSYCSNGVRSDGSKNDD